MYGVVYPLPLTTMNCFSFVSEAMNFWNSMAIELTPWFLEGFSSFPLKNSPACFPPTSYTASIWGRKDHASIRINLAGLTPQDCSRKQLLMCRACCLPCWLIVPRYFLNCPSLSVFSCSRSWSQRSLTASVLCLSVQRASSAAGAYELHQLQSNNNNNSG